MVARTRLACGAQKSLAPMTGDGADRIVVASSSTQPASAPVWQPLGAAGPYGATVAITALAVALMGRQY
jgi:hypothetical protein